ncbi:MAG: bifunctional folylpolyglutamate synthase/dihydrofolate synthase [Deltaproteobacteria bacterium]|nr:bifunctional folylpolyglutamate synthase/dihydrofolate synthase [Deltaproteobacteria bacterium]
MPSSREILRYIYGLERTGIRPGLGRIKKLLSVIKDPQRSYPAVHVAGTNGKGSTSAMLASILTEAGYSAGLYTSPHLVRFNERIRINGADISDKDLARIAARLKGVEPPEGVQPLQGAADGPGLSFFEFTTAIAFEYFREKKIDIAVIEAGMGGRLDATNVLRPLVSIITNIDFDHMDFLGRSLAAIAREKAGIIKPAAAVVTAEVKPEALAVIKAAALKKGVLLYRLGTDFAYKAGKEKNGLSFFDYSGIHAGLTGLGLGLRGPHQLKNGSCALAAVEILQRSGFKISGSAVRRGLKKAFWPARLEVVRKRPLVIIDSAHNPAGAAALKTALRGFRYRRLILVLGIMKDKDIDGFLQAVIPLADRIVLTAPKTARAMSPDGLFMRLKSQEKPVFEGFLRRLKSQEKPVLMRKNVKAALKAALKDAGPQDAVCVAGSIFTAGEAMKALGRGN